MIIRDFNVIGVSVSPIETNSPLVVDANTVLPLAIAFEFVKAIARRGAQIVEIDRTLNMD